LASISALTGFEPAIRLSSGSQVGRAIASCRGGALSACPGAPRKVRAPESQTPGNARGGVTCRKRATEKMIATELSGPVARVKGWCKRPPASAAMSTARQPPSGARPNRGESQWVSTQWVRADSARQASGRLLEPHGNVSVEMDDRRRPWRRTKPQGVNCSGGSSLPEGRHRTRLTGQLGCPHLRTAANPLGTPLASVSHPQRA